jgi:hypothetical protein
MAQDKLQVGLEYDVKGVALAKLEKNIDRSVQKTKVLERAARMTGSRLNKMMDDYKARTQKSESATGKMIKSIGGIALAAVSVDKAIGLVTDSIKLSSDNLENTNKMKVVFGQLYGEADKWSKQYADTMGMSSSKTREAMGDIQNLFVGFGMGREQAFGFGKDIISLANDLDSFNNLSAKGIDVQKNMVSALMGESEAAKAFGVSILEPQMAVASLALGLGKYSNKMDEATKIQIRLKAIQMQSADAMGDVARNLDTEVGKRRRLAAQIENTKLALGDKLMPVQMKMLDVGLKTVGIVNQMGAKFVQFGEAVKSGYGKTQFLIGVVGALGVAFGTYKTIAMTVWAIEKARALWTMATAIPTTLAQNWAIITTTGSLVAQKVASMGAMLGTQLLTGAQWLLNAAFNMSPMGKVVLGLTALAGGFVWAYKKIEPFRNLINSIWEKLQNSTLGKLVGKAFSGASVPSTGSITGGVTGGTTTSFGTTTKPIGSNRTGESFVKNDGMYKLHYGERVLTKAENEQGAQGGVSSSPSINISINAVQELGNEIKRAIQPIVETTIKNYQTKQLMKMGIAGGQ